MKLYWRKVMSIFVDYMNSQEVEQVVISPPLRELSSNTQLIPNTKATSTWATRQNLGFAEWQADLNGWVVHGGDVPMECSEKNVIAKVPGSNPTTGASKRSHGKSPSSEDKPKKVRRKGASAEKSKASSPKPLAVVQYGSGAAPASKSSVPATTSTSSPSPLKQYRRKTSVGRIKALESSKESGDSEETRSEGYDFEYTATDFGNLLFLASVSSCISSPNVLCSLGPTDEDIEMAGESPTADVTVGETAVGEPNKEYAGKDPDVAVTTGEAVTGVPNQRRVISSTGHDVHQSKEPLELQVVSFGATIKGMSIEEFLEKFAEDEENEKVATDFYPLSSDTVIFQRSEIPTEG
nr:hypothetical protein CFP56_38407 [Quercus suber]